MMMRRKSSGSAGGRQSTGSDVLASRSTGARKTTGDSSGKRTSTGCGPHIGSTPASGEDQQQPVIHNAAKARVRDPAGTGKFVARTPMGLPLPDQPPEWVARQPQETDESWSSRIWGHFLEYQLNQGFTHDLVALKRHELAAKHLWPTKHQLEVTGRPEWPKWATDEQLATLEAIQADCVARMQAGVPPDLVLSGELSDGSNGDDS